MAARASAMPAGFDGRTRSALVSRWGARTPKNNIYARRACPRPAATLTRQVEVLEHDFTAGLQVQQLRGHHAAKVQLLHGAGGCARAGRAAGQAAASSGHAFLYLACIPSPHLAAGRARRAPQHAGLTAGQHERAVGAQHKRQRVAGVRLGQRNVVLQLDPGVAGTELPARRKGGAAHVGGPRPDCLPHPRTIPEPPPHSPQNTHRSLLSATISSTAVLTEALFTAGSASRRRLAAGLPRALRPSSARGAARAGGGVSVGWPFDDITNRREGALLEAQGRGAAARAAPAALRKSATRAPPALTF